jgi:hypothetical protein
MSTNVFVAVVRIAYSETWPACNEIHNFAEIIKLETPLGS